MTAVTLQARVLEMGQTILIFIIDAIYDSFLWSFMLFIYFQ